MPIALVSLWLDAKLWRQIAFCVQRGFLLDITAFRHRLRVLLVSRHDFTPQMFHYCKVWWGRLPCWKFCLRGMRKKKKEVPWMVIFCSLLTFVTSELRYVNSLSTYWLN